MPELTLVHPERWWWLLLLLPLLLVLALPPRPRRVALTAHLPQWRLALEGLRRKPPRTFSWRTLLLLFAGACAASAALGCAIAGTPGPTRLVVALDSSASMARRGAADGTALERARAALARTFAVLPDHVEVTLLRCGGAMLRRHGASARALHDLGVAEGARTVDFVALAAALAADPAANDTVLWTLTDGQGQTALPTTGALTFVGAAAANAAVLAVRVADHWPLPELELEVDVIAFAPAATPARLAVRGAVAATPTLELQLQPGVVQTVQWSLRREAKGGELQVEVAMAADPLARDDRWTATLPPLPAPRIAVLQGDEGGPFARIAAEALAREVAGEVVPASSGAAVGLLLVDGGNIAAAPGTARALCFGSRYRGGPAADPWTSVGALDWNRTLPLLHGLDLSELRVDRVHGETVASGEPFLFAERGGERLPIAVIAAGEERASLHFGFRLQDSNLPLLAAFPQLLRRAFVRCYGAAAELRDPSPPPPAGEQDLHDGAVASDRPLPPFGSPPQPLGGWLMLAGLLALVLRVWLR